MESKWFSMRLLHQEIGDRLDMAGEANGQIGGPCVAKQPLDIPSYPQAVGELPFPGS